MAAFKKPCLRCGTFIEGDARICAGCGSRSPFGYRCPTCMKEIQREQALCTGCGRALRVACPSCGHLTFTDERCEKCGAALLVPCANPRCGELQFFQNEKCIACGKKMKKK